MPLSQNCEKFLFQGEIMNIQGLQPQEVSNKEYLLGKNAQDKANSWGDMPIGTSYNLMFAKLKQMKNMSNGLRMRQNNKTKSAIML